MNLKSLANEYCKHCGCILEDSDEVQSGICFVCNEEARLDYGNMAAELDDSDFVHTEYPVSGRIEGDSSEEQLPD